MNTPTSYAFCYAPNWHLVALNSHHNELTQIGPHNEPSITNHILKKKFPLKITL